MTPRFRPRFEISVTPEDVGRRVSVRRRLPDGWLTDAVGVLESWEHGRLTVRRRNGALVEIREETLVAGKVVPPAPPARRPRGRPGGAGPEELAPDLTDLLAASARSWPAPETEPLGGWVLRAADGFSQRANSVTPLGDPGVPLDEALERVVRWYARRSLPPRIQVLSGSDVDEQLGRRGWRAESETLILLARVDAALAAVAAVPGGGEVDLAAEPTEPWMRVYAGDGGLPEAARQVLGSGPGLGFATAREVNGTPVAVGRAAADGRWLGVAAVRTDPAHRRRGMARAIMRALLQYGERAGAEVAYLQVEEHNDPAQRLYAQMGFSARCRYHYRALRLDK